MALAALRYDGISSGSHRFLVDIGSNRYFAWAVGGDRTRSGGLTMLGRRASESPLLGPLGPEQRGRTVLEVPMELFSGENPSIQILSFRSQSLEGPAVSEIIDPPASSADLSRLRLRRAANGANGRSVAQDHSMSRALFLDAIAGVIRGVLPALQTIAPAIEPLVRLISAAPAAGAGAAPAATPGAATTPGGATGQGSAETQRLIADLVRQVASLLTGAPAAAGAGAAQAGSGAPAANGSGGASRAGAMALTGNPLYSEAAALPAALLAALPALMPLLQQVLTPQTVQSVIQAGDPNRLLNTITTGITELAKVGLQADQQLMDHLRALNPGLGDDVAVRLLESASLSTTGLAHLPPYRRTDAVRLRLPEVVLTDVGGRPATVFASDREWTFPLTVDTPRPIATAHLHLAVKDGATLRPKFETGYDVAVQGSGLLDVVPTVPAEVVGQLRRSADHLVCLTLTWGTKRGRLGTSITQSATVAAPASVGRFTGEGELVPLNDVDAHRDFWHRAWAGTFDDRCRRVDLALTYEYRFDPRSAGLVRDHSVVDGAIPEGRRELTGSVRTGVRCGPDALNQLLRALTGASLTADELDAFRDPTLSRRLGGGARTRARLHGRPGDAAAVWVWPEVKVHRVVLQRPDEIGPTGQVLGFAEHEVRFPFPALAHVVGVAT